MTSRPTTPPPRAPLDHLIPHYRRHGRAFAVGFVLLLLTSLSAAGIPYLMKLAIDAMKSGAPASEVRHAALLLVALALLNALFRIASRVRIYQVGRQVEHDLREAYHAKLLTLDGPFFDRQKTGDLVARGINDITAVRMFIGPGFLQISNAVMTYAAILPVMVGLDLPLALLALAPLPVVLLLARVLTRWLYSHSRVVADQFGALSAFVQETVSGMAVVRAHAQEENWNRRFRGNTEILYGAHLEHARLQSLFAPLMLLSGGLGTLIILAHGGRLVAQGDLTIGDFVAFTGYLAMLIWPTVGLGWILTVLQRGLAALERIGAVLDTPSPHYDTTTGPAVPAVFPHWRGEIQVKNLTFAYPDGPAVLHGISLTLPPGRFIGLAGRVGSGKSALLNCLARLYPVPPGTVFMEGRDLTTIPEAELRHNLAMAPQESYLFSTTVGENLTYGLEENDPDHAWAVARQSAFDQEIGRFPDGLETIVGERGITLSGGQRQRAALARALAMNPRVLLLDDVFSSVDARTEARILDNILAFAEGRTTLMVCHRVAALHRAETIYLLDGGRIVAQGDHATLMETTPLYRDLHNQMARSEALEELQ